MSTAEPFRPNGARPLTRGTLDPDWSPLWSGLARIGGVLPPQAEPAGERCAVLERAALPQLRPASLRYPAIGPRFDVEVGPGGYAWWYVDATSDCGRYGLTIIAFIGSVFSPYCKMSGRHDPENFCSINVSLHGPRANAWAMTERTRDRVTRDATSFEVGPSGLHWDGNALYIHINETSAPLPYPVRGIVCIRPEAIGTTGFHLHPAGRHRWHPIAPRARVEVAMAQPGTVWRGDGYFDSNFGEESLEDGFVDWHWSRAHLRRDVAVLYEGTRRNGKRFELALKMDRQGNWEDEIPPPTATLPSSRWGIRRVTRADAGARPSVRKTWIDAPFYARSALTTRLFGEDACAVHESLSLNRFRSPVVQAMLPFRMPRAG